jgi:integrase
MTYLARIEEIAGAQHHRTLIDVRRRAEEALMGLQRRDTLSALDCLAKVFGLRLDAVPATASRIRDLLGSRTAAELGLSEKRYANISAAVRSAVRIFGATRIPITRRVALSPEWTALLERIEHKEHRWGLNRLACYASAAGIVPIEVTRQTLLGLFDALEREDGIKQPRKTLKHTIALWNMCHKSVPSWPETRLESPFESTAYTLRLDQFPKSFQEEVERWRTRLLEPDPFDDDVPASPLKPVSVERNERYLRRCASVLVSAGHIRLDEVTGLKVLVTVDRVKLAMKLLLTRCGGLPSDHVARHAVVLRAIAKYEVKLEEAELRQLDMICRKLSPAPAFGMRARNRDLLRQFDDTEKVHRLLALPETERHHALRQTNAYRRAKGIERALAIALLIDTGLRIKNLCGIRLDQDLHWTRVSCFLSVDPRTVKNKQALEFELTPATISLLRQYLAEYRCHLKGTEGPYLFPGKDGGPIALCTMRHDITTATRRRAGLRMHPHLFRHAIAKIVVERDSELYMAVSQHLGHRNLRTTMANYLGTETRAAGRKVNALLEDVKRTGMGH